MSPKLAPVLFLLVFSSAGACAADLTKLERPILKEPAYRSQPKYCLLVFGPEGNTKIWLVQDGDVLYVDRNGNGDLTEAGKRVTAEKQQAGDDGDFTFKVGDVRDGPRLHKELTVCVASLGRLGLAKDEPVKSLLKRNPKALGYCILVEMDMPSWKGMGLGGRVQQRAFFCDLHGILQFGERPSDAPVVHFGGPWQVALFSRHRLTIGRATDVVLGVGTPGVGPGATAWVDYEGVIPANVYPTLEVVYPPKYQGERPVCEHYVLKRRC